MQSVTKKAYFASIFRKSLTDVSIGYLTFYYSISEFQGMDQFEDMVI